MREFIARQRRSIVDLSLELDPIDGALLGIGARARRIAERTAELRDSRDLLSREHRGTDDINRSAASHVINRLVVIRDELQELKTEQSALLGALGRHRNELWERRKQLADGRAEAHRRGVQALAEYERAIALLFREQNEFDGARAHLDYSAQQSAQTNRRSSRRLSRNSG
jgi:hypothetical protein